MTLCKLMQINCLSDHAHVPGPEFARPLAYTNTKQIVMKYNLGFIDIAFRYTLMAALVIAGATTQSIWLMPLAVGVFLSAILGYCPLYDMLGVDSCSDYLDK